MRRAWTEALDSMIDKKGRVRKREQRWHQLCHTDWDSGEEVKGLPTAGAVSSSSHSGWGCKSKGRVFMGEESQSLFSSTNICGVPSPALRNALSSSNLQSPSPGVSPHAGYLLGGFVRNCRCWAVGEDCPASPAIRVCAFLCQQTVMLKDVTRKQILAFVAQTHFWWETYPRRESFSKRTRKL